MIQMLAGVQNILLMILIPNANDDNNYNTNKLNEYNNSNQEIFYSN